MLETMQSQGSGAASTSARTPRVHHLVQVLQILRPSRKGDRHGCDELPCEPRYIDAVRPASIAFSRTMKR